MRETNLYINGKWHPGDSSAIDVVNPWSGAIVAHVSSASRALVAAAIDAAATASPLAAHERSRILREASASVAANSETYAELITAETAKPISASYAEVERAVVTLLMSADEASSIQGASLDLAAQPSGEGIVAFTRTSAVGVVAAITPFNFPLNLVCHKLGPALAAGCPVVLKPSEKAPGAAALLAQAFHDAGLPPGHLNTVTGDPAMIVDELLRDDRVAAVTFTGSSALGWSLKQRAPRKRFVLELGSNTAMLVADDADIERAAEAAARAAFTNSGQACISLQRTYVHEAVLSDFLYTLVPRVEALKTGDPMDPSTDVGPLITEDAAVRVASWIADSVTQGGQVVTGGGPRVGSLVEPTVVLNPPEDSRIVCEEVFGPVLSVIAVRDVADGLARVNNSRFGLNARDLHEVVGDRA
jgi:acyl-CoA reductase-like NAD-dependent aldehyde dehydrogenase